jgi:hypothetical protein
MKNDSAGKDQWQFTQPVTQLTEEQKTFALKMSTAESGETLENHQHSVWCIPVRSIHMPLLKEQ